MLGQNIAGFLFAIVYTLQATAQYSSPCAEECATQAYSGSECSDGDYECICSNGSFPDTAYDCLSANCPEEADIGGADYGAACTGVTSTTMETTATETTETETTDSVSSFASEGSTSGTDSLVYTTDSVISSSALPSDYNDTISSLPSSSYPSSSLPSSSYASPSPPPSVYASSSSSRPSTVSPPSSPPNAYGSSSPPPATPTGAADRNAVLPVAFVQLMAVMVAMAML